MRDRATENEPPRFDARNLRDSLSCPGIHQLVDCAPERAWIAEKRCGVCDTEQEIGIAQDGRIVYEN